MALTNLSTKIVAQLPEDQRIRLLAAIEALGGEGGGKKDVIVLFGAPGSGKGTYGAKMIDRLGIPQLSTGDLLREAVAAGTEIGLKAKSVMESGGFVSDEIVIGIIKDRIQQPDCAGGFILDGFPRTVEQAASLDKELASVSLSVNLIIALEVPDEVLTDRICGRWVHKASGRSYHVKNKKPKSLPEGAVPSEENMKDDETGEALMRRADDTEETLAKRLKAYYDQTLPILAHYDPTGIVRKVDSDDTKGKNMDDIWASIDSILSTTSIKLSKEAQK